MSAAEDGRVTALERAIAHQARTVEELSDEIRRQGETIDRLEKTLRALAQRFLDLEDNSMGQPENGRPPHY